MAVLQGLFAENMGDTTLWPGIPVQ
jgi:hypothetical protein